MRPGSDNEVICLDFRELTPPGQEAPESYNGPIWSTTDGLVLSLIYPEAIALGKQLLAMAEAMRLGDPEFFARIMNNE